MSSSSIWQKKNRARHRLYSLASPQRWPSWDTIDGGLPCSSMMAVGGDVLPVTSLTSAYPHHLVDIHGGFFPACMSRLRACRRRMAQSQTLEALYDAAASRAATMPVPLCNPTSRRGASRHSSSSCIGEARCRTTCWLSAATASDGLGEEGGEASYRARRASQTTFMLEN